MKTMILATLLVFSSMAMAKMTRIINVFYDGRTGEFAVNTERESGRSGFIRTNKIVFVSSELSLCQSGCLASIEAKNYSSFVVVVAGHKVATVITNDSDNLLSSKAFQIIQKSGKEFLVLNIDTLKQDGKAEVK